MDQETRPTVTVSVKNQDKTLEERRREFFDEHGELCLECGECYDLFGGRRPFVEAFCGHIKCRDCVGSSTNDAECLQCQSTRNLTTREEVTSNSAEPSHIDEEMPAEINSSSKCIASTVEPPAVKTEVDRSDPNPRYVTTNSSDRYDCTNSASPKSQEIEETECYGPDSGIEVSIEEFVIPYYPGDYLQYDGDPANFPACLPVAEEVIIEPEPNEVPVATAPEESNGSSSSSTSTNLSNDGKLLTQRCTTPSEVQIVRGGLDNLKLVESGKSNGDTILRNALIKNPKAMTKNMGSLPIANNVTRPRNRFLRAKEKNCSSTNTEKDDFLKQLNVHRNEGDKDYTVTTTVHKPVQNNRPKDLTIRPSSRKLLNDNDTSPVVSSPTGTTPTSLPNLRLPRTPGNSLDSSPDAKKKRIDPSTRLISRTTFKPTLFHLKELEISESVEVKVEPKLEPEELPFGEYDDPEGSEISSTISTRLSVLDLNIKAEDVAVEVSEESEIIIPAAEMKIESTPGLIETIRPSTSASAYAAQIMPLTEKNEVEQQQQPRTSRACRSKPKPPVPNNPPSSSVKKSKSVKKRNKRVPVPTFDHITIVQGETESYRCEICRKNFKTRAHIRYHEFCVSSDGKEKPFHCEICDKGFISKSHFVYHLRTHTDERPFVCNVCGKGFNASGKLSRHAKIHTGDKPYACQHCPRLFSNPQGLKSHELVHTGERPFACDICPMRFKGLTNLKKHTVTHSGERPHVCETCGKRFGLKWTLDMHIKTHSNFRPFACNECSKAFGNRKDLRRHQTIHSSLRPFKCPNCGVTFRRKDNLDRHIKNMHNAILGTQVSAIRVTVEEG